MPTPSFTIEALYDHHHNWEPVPQGEFETAEAAFAAVTDLQDNLGWNSLRVVDQNGNVVLEAPKPTQGEAHDH